MSDLQSTFDEVVERLAERFQMLAVEEKDTPPTDLILRAVEMLGRMVEPLSKRDPSLDEVSIVRETSIALAAIGLFLGTIGSVAEDDLYRGPFG